MSPQWFRSQPSRERRPPLEYSPSRANNSNDNDNRLSSASDTSIEDVEAGFLPPQQNGRRSVKDTLRFNLPFIKKSSPSTDLDKYYKRGWRIYRWISAVLVVILFGVTAAFLVLEIPRRSHKITNGVEMIISRWGLPSPSTQKALTNWPTDLTRDITTIPCHSHNDYWRRVPLYDALAAGCTGVEADVWIDESKPDDLFVGHTRKSLTSARTLRSLYIDPLLTILNNQNNPPNISTTTTTTTNTNKETTGNKLGVFDTSPTTSLTLLIDLKTASESTFPRVLEQLQPLLQAGYLTTYTPSTGLVQGPITVV
ncbi:MAG: hypothetical protein Q9201_003709, partial [Fulgogasparrea decipioides]